MYKVFLVLPKLHVARTNFLCGSAGPFGNKSSDFLFGSPEHTPCSLSDHHNARPRNNVQYHCSTKTAYDMLRLAAILGELSLGGS